MLSLLQDKYEGKCTDDGYINQILLILLIIHLD